MTHRQIKEDGGDKPTEQEIDPTDDTVDAAVTAIARQQTTLLASSRRARAGGFDTQSPTTPVEPRQRPFGAAGFEQRYRLNRTLGEGGMGEVRLSEDRHIGRDVAIKLMHSGQNENTSLRLRFEREAQIQGQLEHPSVVPVYDLGVRPDGSLFFVMRRVWGLTIEQIIEGLRTGDEELRRTYTEHKLLSAFATACLAVEYAHRRKVVHRDLKPANIILGQFGEVYLLDWGIAKVLEQEADPFLITADDDTPTALREQTEKPVTVTGTMLGTPLYMAPEQISGDHRAISSRSDVYSLGLILFELLTLEPLNAQPDVYQVLISHLRGLDVKARLRELGLTIAPELVDICVRATALDPNDRTASAREIHDELEKYLAGTRDQHRRSQLADEHVNLAQEALRHAETDVEKATELRTQAVQELTAAIALVPEHHAAITTLVNTFGKAGDQLPPEAETEFQTLQQRRQQQVTRVYAVRLIAYLLVMLPIGFWAGIRDSRPIWVLTASTIIMAIFNYTTHRLKPIPKWRNPISILLGVVVAGCTIPLFGPLIFVPMIALGLCVAMTVNIRASKAVRHYLMFMTLPVIAAPLGLQWLGWLPSSYAFTEQGTMSVLPWVIEFSGSPALVLLLVASLVFIWTTLAVIGRSVDELRTAERRLFAQAWHAKQWMPTEGHRSQQRRS